MRARFLDISSAQAGDLEKYRPLEDAFAFEALFYVAVEGEEGEAAFDLFICSPQWLVENLSPGTIISGRHYLIMKQYNYERLIQFMKEFVNGCEGDDTIEVLQKVGRLGLWEFEGFKGWTDPEGNLLPEEERWLGPKDYWPQQPDTSK